MTEKLGYRGNSELKKAGLRFEWTPELIKEYIRCKNDIIYFAEHYFHIITEEGMSLIKLRDYQKEMILSMQNNRFTISNQSRQSGKALSLNTPIFTPNGKKLFKDVHQGDEIYSIDGKKTKITFETDIMYNHKCFNIEFSHGEIITADEDHVWSIELNNGKKIKKIDVTTKKMKEILEKQHLNKQSIRIKISDPIKFEEKILPIDPYLLGLWLGDGSKSRGYITCHEDDLENYKNYIDIEWIYSDTRNEKIKQIKIRNLHNDLEKLNLLYNKHIPNIYLENSIEKRISLLQGLMDTDGSVTNAGSFEFYQKDKNLIDQVRFLLSTLGIKSTLREKLIKEEVYYILAFCNRNFDFFRLKRKLDITKKRRKKDHIKNFYFYIKNISETESVPVKCIQVDNPSHLFLCGNTLIPTHNTESFRVFLTHYILFNDYKTVAVLANKGDVAREILSKLQISYQALPIWLQLGVTEFNKGSFVLENKSRIIAMSTSKTAARSYTAHIVILDEMAFIENFEDFYTAVYPTISAGKETKLIITSTPNGLNQFYEFWKGATEKDPTKWNGFHAFFVPWYRVPGRDDKWKDDTLRGMNYNYQKFEAEFACEFLGSSGTLIGGWKLKLMIGSHLKAINTPNDIKLKIYESPIKEIKEIVDNKPITIPPHTYIIVADVSRGKGLDYSAFSIIDVTQLPYRQVAAFRDNNIVPADYADIILKTAQYFNNAYILVEINDIGDQIGYMLQIDYGYDNVLCTENAGRLGKKISFGGKKADKGIRTTTPVKALGCSMLKLLIEQDKLIIADENAINEFTTFSKEKNTYKAEKGKFDDMVMGLVLFSWLTEQQYFKEMTDINTAGALKEMTAENIASNLLSFGFINQPVPMRTYDEWAREVNLNFPFRNFVEDPQVGSQIISDGIVWNVSSPERNNPNFW